MKRTEETKFISKHLSKVDQLEFILLKGHLLFEHQVSFLIETNHLAKPDGFAQLRLSFDQKLRLLECLNNDQKTLASITLHLRNLNQLRNKLAHQLDFTPHKEKLVQWALDVLGTKRTEVEDISDKKLVMHAIYFLYGQLVGYYRAYAQFNS